MNEETKNIEIQEQTDQEALAQETQEALSRMRNLTIAEIQKLGSEIQQQLGQDVDVIAQRTMSIDCEEAGKTLAALTTATDIKMLMPKNALVAKVINPVRKTTRRYKSIEKNLLTLSTNIYTAKESLDKNLSDIDVLLQASRKHFAHLGPYIEAIELKVNELEALKKKKIQEGEEESIEVLEIGRVIDAFRRRQKDLAVSKVVAYQTVKECILLSGSNEALSERMQYAIDNLIPLYKQQLVAAVAVRIQKDSAKIIRSMTSAVNNLMVDTAKNISSNMNEIKALNESPILDINKLKEVEGELNHLLEQMKKQNAVNQGKHEEFMKSADKLVHHELRALSDEISVTADGKVVACDGEERPLK